MEERKMQYRTIHEIDDQGTDVEWEYTFHGFDKTLSADTCPYCGSAGFFNATWSTSGQYARCADEDEKGEYALDAENASRISYVRCGHCGETLVDKSGEEGPAPQRITSSQTESDPTPPVDRDREWADVEPQSDGIPAEDNSLVPDAATEYRTVTTADSKEPSLAITIHREYTAKGDKFHVTGTIRSETESEGGAKTEDTFIKLSICDTGPRANTILERNKKSPEFIE